MDEKHNGWPPLPSDWPPVLNPVQAAQYLHLHEGRSIDAARQALRALCRDRGLKNCGRVGRFILFRRETIDRWLAEQEVAEVGGGA